MLDALQRGGIGLSKKSFKRGCRMDFAISDAVRARIEKDGGEFRANQNIAKWLRPGEREALQREVESRVGSLLRSLVIDVQNDHNTKETAERVAKMFCQDVLPRGFRRAL